MDYRRMDKRRRITIPAEIRYKLNLNEYELIELRITYGKIAVRKLSFEDSLKIPIIGTIRQLDRRGGFIIPKHYIQFLQHYTNKFAVSLDDKDNAIILTPISID